MTESAGYPNVIAARSVDDETPTDLAMDPTGRTLYVALWTWNTSGTAWEKVADINDKLDTIISLLTDIKTNTTP